MTASPTLELRGVDRSFGPVHVLSSVNFTTNAGEATALVGGLVVAVIVNGMSDLVQGANSAAYEFVVTGAILLLAAGFDAVVRRGAGRLSESATSENGPSTVDSPDRPTARAAPVSQQGGGARRQTDRAG